ncbi:DNA ligase 1 isoform X1 [Penaeus vannamei]|uniref:DNA ligase 1 isoform X1 n=1 Tax=Penaeus vannamei TaxID=6689 RepID=UPI00387FA5C8
MEPRRSSRPVIKPVKFWDFEKPDFSKVEQISYSIAELTRTFARPESSAKPKKQAVVSGEDGEKLNAKNPISKKAVQSAKPRKHQRVQSHSVDTKALKKRDEDTSLSKTINPDATPLSQRKALARRKLVKDFKRKIKKHQITLQTTSNSTMSTVSVMNDTKALKKRDEDTSLSKTINPDATPLPQDKSLARRKLVKDFKRKIKKHQITLQTSNSTMSTVSVMNATDISRRSGRVRVKPLEFWNFEKIEVKKADDGQVQVISHKVDMPEPRKRKPWETNGTVTATTLPQPIPKRQNVTSKKDESPKKRRKSEETKQENLKEKKTTTKEIEKEQEKEKKGGSRSKDNTQKEERQASKEKKGEREREETSNEGSPGKSLQIVKFKDLYFLHYLMKECNCFLAKSYEDPKHGVFAGFVFLEGGSLLWQAKKDMFIKVISGRGTLKMVNTETMEGVHMALMNKGSANITTGTKVEIIKDRRCKMIKFFVEIKSANLKEK